MSGSKIDDHISSVELNRSALRWALKFLRSNGCFVAWAGKCWKLLQGKLDSGSLEDSGCCIGRIERIELIYTLF